MKIIHVITSLKKAAGTSVFCAEVCNGLVAIGHDVTIAVVDPNCADCCPIDPHIKLISISSLLYNSAQSTCSTRLECDVIHIHALWSPVLHKVSKWAHENKIPIVWSTHGMTAPWSMKHKWWKKLPAWLLYQKRDLLQASLIHCTTELEFEWNNALGFKNCFIAPLGTHLPQLHPPTPAQNSNATLLFVGRIYPVKGLVNLIMAWQKVFSAYSASSMVKNWKLRIVGPDQAEHKAELEVLIKDMGLCDSVEFVGPRYDKDLSQEYDNCDCLVLPSFTENFGATIVDALAHGKPCIASTFTPWKVLKDCSCGWWVSNEPSKLSIAIDEMIALSSAERREMGLRGRKLVAEKYTWDAVAEAMEKGYESVMEWGS